MDQRFRDLVLAIACLLSLCASLHGEAMNAHRRVIRFTVFTPEPTTTLAYVVQAKPARKVAPIVLFPSMRSPVYEFSGEEPLEFIDAATGKAVAVANVPRDMDNPLIVLFPIPADASGARFRVFIHDDSKSKLRHGALGILNFSGLRLSGFVGRQAVDLASFGFAGAYEIGSSAKVQLNTTIRSRTLTSFSETLSVEKANRALLILLPPFRRGSLEVQSRLLIDEAPPSKLPGSERR